MDRRQFLINLFGLTAVAAVQPKFIFDMGANLYKRKKLLITIDEANDFPLPVIGISWSNWKRYSAVDLSSVNDVNGVMSFKVLPDKRIHILDSTIIENKCNFTIDSNDESNI